MHGASSRNSCTLGVKEVSFCNKKIKYFVLFSYPFDTFMQLHDILLWICISLHSTKEIG
jgi:hypothetical protein